MLKLIDKPSTYDTMILMFKSNFLYVDKAYKIGAQLLGVC